VGARIPHPRSDDLQRDERRPTDFIDRPLSSPGSSRSSLVDQTATEARKVFEHAIYEAYSQIEPLPVAMKDRAQVFRTRTRVTADSGSRVSFRKSPEGRLNEIVNES